MHQLKPDVTAVTKNILKHTLYQGISQNLYIMYK